MKAVVQRVRRAEVCVEGEVVGSIETGLCVLVGVQSTDTERDLAYLAQKLPALRIFSDADGKMNRNVVDAGGSVLLISQFTLCADTSKGNRPSFVQAMEPRQAKAMFDQLVEKVGAVVPVATGQFQADMQVSLVNDGPVTLVLDSQARKAAEG